jgi:predicted transcriptional regulator
MADKENVTTVRLTDTQTKALEQIGKRDDRSVSWLIRKAIDELIQRDKKERR